MGVAGADQQDASRACAGLLSGRTVAVIGGSSGIGLATATSALAAGARVWAMGRDADRLAQAKALAGDDLLTHIGDASTDDDVRQFFGLVGEIDHLLLTAGAPMFAPIATMDIEQGVDWLANGFRAILLAARHGHWRDCGSFTLLSASAVRRPRPGGGLLGALARSTEYLAETLALELAPVRVNVIAPGFVPTPLTQRMLGDRLASRIAELEESLPTSHVVEPTDIASLVLQLMLNPALTGAVIPIDSGQALS